MLLTSSLARQHPNGDASLPKQHLFCALIPHHKMPMTSLGCSEKLFVVLSPGRPAGESDRRKLLAKGMPTREKSQKLVAESPAGAKIVRQCLNVDFQSV